MQKYTTLLTQKLPHLNPLPPLASCYESSEVGRDSFIIPGIEEFFSALTQNLAFFPQKLMACFPTQNGSQLEIGRAHV